MSINDPIRMSSIELKLSALGARELTDRCRRDPYVDVVVELSVNEMLRLASPS